MAVLSLELSITIPFGSPPAVGVTDQTYQPNWVNQSFCAACSYWAGEVICGVDLDVQVKGIVLKAWKPVKCLLQISYDKFLYQMDSLSLLVI